MLLANLGGRRADDVADLLSFDAVIVHAQHDVAVLRLAEGHRPKFATERAFELMLSDSAIDDQLITAPRFASFDAFWKRRDKQLKDRQDKAALPAAVDDGRMFKPSWTKGQRRLQSSAG